jgi:hypothetical protein
MRVAVIFPEIWTSSLNIRITIDDEDVYDLIKQEILDRIDLIESIFPTIHGNHKDYFSIMDICKFIDPEDFLDVLEFAQYRGRGEDPDFTGLMKGLAIREISQILQKYKFDHYTIDFGRDIMTVNRQIHLKEAHSKLGIELTNGCAFTSGNWDSERGNHITVEKPHDFLTISVISQEFNPVYCDMMATKIFSNPDYAKLFNGDVVGITRGFEQIMIKDRYS